MSRCRFGLYEFDFRSGELRREGDFVKLSPQPARVLALLLTRPGELVLRDEFRREIWGSDTFVDFERGLNFCILQVRGALGDSSENPRFVQTVPRKGYRFIAPVSIAPPRATSLPTADDTPLQSPPATSPLSPSQAATSAGLPSSSESHGQPPAADSVARHSQRAVSVLRRLPGATSIPGESRGPTSVAPDLVYPPAEVKSGVASRGHRSAWIIAFAAVLILAPVAWLVFAARSTSGPTAAAAAPYRIRIAVLPFVNLTGDASMDYLADGLTDELITQLGTLSRQRVAVIARTSAMTYRNTSRTVARIGEELDVQYVVESSVRRDATGLRVGTNLVSVVDETPFAGWSETFDNTAATPDAHQRAAAIRIARLIAVALLPDSVGAPAAPRAVDAAAWDQYLQGLALVNRGTADAVRRALSHFETATTKDPGFAAGWAKIAESRHLLTMMGALAPTAAYPAARDAADRAVAADPDLPEAHLARGLVHLWFDWQPAAAAASFERALALNDSLAAAHHDYAWSLMALGRTDAAIRHIVEARDLDPLSTRANTDIGWLYLHLRQPADAARACGHTLAIEPASLEAQACLERAHTQRGMFDAALEAARATLPASAASAVPADAKPVDALRAIWRWRLQQMEEAAQTRWISPYTLAVQHLVLGDTVTALDFLEQAHRERVGMLVFLAHDPALEPLRREPRFLALQRISETAR